MHTMYETSLNVDERASTFWVKNLHKAQGVYYFPEDLTFSASPGTQNFHWRHLEPQFLQLLS